MPVSYPDMHTEPKQVSSCPHKPHDMGSSGEVAHMRGVMDLGTHEERGATPDVLARHGCPVQDQAAPAARPPWQGSAEQFGLMDKELQPYGDDRCRHMKRAGYC